MRFYEFHQIVKSANPPALKLQWEYNADTFQSWFMSEVTKEIAKDLESWKDENPNELPFQGLFPAENDEPITRRVIPFTADPVAVSILDKIQHAGLNIDFKTGTVTNGQRATRLGKLVLNKNSPFSTEEKTWWNLSGEPIPELQRTQSTHQYAIVVSRNPIDIARMSDHDGWTSCHAPSREYFQCAISDAKGGGAIAYVAKKADLAGIDLQEPEIFSDKRRGVSGVNPISRVRLRKFVHKEDGYDLAVPEDRTYGKEFPGLTDSVRDWALQSQQVVLKGQRPSMDEFKLMGGSYQDTQGSDLFNYFFNDDLDSGDAEYGGDGDGQGMFAQYEEEVEIIEKEFRNSFTICSFYASVEESEGAPYVSYSGTVYIKIPEELLLPLPKETDVWGPKSKGWQIRKELEKWAKDNEIYNVNEVEYDDEGLRIEIHDDSGTNPDDFRSFCENTLKDIDEKKDELQASLYHKLVEMGLATANKVSQINNDLDNENAHAFQHFEWQGKSPEVSISLKEPMSLPAPPQTNAGFQHEYWQDQFKQSVMQQINAWADRVVTIQKQQPSLFPDMEQDHKRPFELHIKPEIELKPKDSWKKGEPGQPLFMFMKLNFETFSNDEHVEDAINFAKFLDKNFPKFESMIYQIYMKWINNWGKPQPSAQPAPMQHAPNPAPTQPEQPPTTNPAQPISDLPNAAKGEERVTSRTHG